MVGRIEIMKVFTKTILSLVLMLAMMVGNTTPILAASEQSFSGGETARKEESFTSKSLIQHSVYNECITSEPFFWKSLEENESKVYANAQGYFDDTRQQKSVLGSISLATNSNQVEVHLTLKQADFSEGLDLSGKVYVLHGNGYYDEKLILGDFDGSSKYNIPLFKILNESEPVLSIILEDIASGELYALTFVLPQSLFMHLFKIAVTTTGEYENELEESVDDPALVKEKMIEWILSLYQPSKNFKSSVNLSLPRSQSHQNFKSTDSNSASYAGLTVLQNFCSALNNPPYSVTPSSTLQSIFSQVGWGMYYLPTNHFYVIHTVVNSSYEYLISLTVAAMSDYRPDTTTISAGYGIVGSCSITYNPITKVADLLYYNTGVRLENALIAIELLGGTTNFHKVEKTSSLGNSIQLKDIWVAVLSDLGYPTAIWSALQSTHVSTPTVQLGSDSYQISMYGDIVRAVANETASGYNLWGYGNDIHVTGYHYNNSIKQYILHTIRWSFTAYSLF